MNRLLRVLVVFMGLSSLSLAQNSKLDSLENLLKTVKSDTTKVKLLAKVAYKYRFIHPEKTIRYAKEGLALAVQLRYFPGMFENYWSLAKGMQVANQYQEAMPYLKRWEEISDSLNNMEQKLRCLDRQALMYTEMGDYSKSLVCYYKCLRVDEGSKNKNAMASDYGNIGLVYQSMKKYPMAIEYIMKAQKLDEETGDSAGYANAIGNLGGIYDEMGDHQKALNLTFQFLKLVQQLGNKPSEAGALSNIGSNYDQLGMKNEAFEYYMKSQAIAEELGLEDIIIANDINIGTSYLSRKQYNKALEPLQKGLALSVKTGSKPSESSSCRLLADAYKGLNELPKAYEYLNRYDKLKDTLLNEANTKQVNQMAAMYEKDRQQLAINGLEKEQKLKDIVIEKQTNFRNILYVVVILIVLLAFVLFLAFINKRKDNRLLELSNIEINKQKEIIEERNKNMKDSINYAKRIQEAILPAKDLKYTIFPEAFILFQPRDIVSGDFYWYAEKEGKRIIAAVDCTGHGVPGAFMSMIGIDQLNHIVLHAGITTPALILDRLQLSIREALKQNTNTADGTRDGMDIAICTVDTLKGEVEYAGANRQLVVVRKKEQALECVDPDHLSIGGLQYGTGAQFTNHMLQLLPGDCFYIFTDGYADQFGGEKGKKFRVKNLKDLFLSLSPLAMSEQEDSLYKIFTDWKGNLEQVDDVLVIGVRI